MKRKKEAPPGGKLAGLPFRRSDNGVVMEVRVQPRSSRKGVEGVEDGGLKVRLTAPPVGGEANAQLREVLAGHFGVRKSAVRILRGASSKNKTVEIEGV